MLSKTVGYCVKEILNKSVRIELVEMHARKIKSFDKLSPNGGYLFGVSLINYVNHDPPLGFKLYAKWHVGRNADFMLIISDTRNGFVLKRSEIGANADGVHLNPATSLG